MTCPLCDYDGTGKTVAEVYLDGFAAGAAVMYFQGQQVGVAEMCPAHDAPMKDRVRLELAKIAKVDRRCRGEQDH